LSFFDFSRRTPSSDENDTSERPTWVRYRVLAWLTLAAALAYLTRNAVGVAESSIRADLGLTLQQSGWFMGAFFWTYAIFQVPAGWLAHRYGTRRALAGFALTWTIATVATGIAPGIALLVVAQLLMGAAQAGIFPASCNSISHWISMGRRSIACGMLATGMQLGAIVAGTLTGVLIADVGWRWVFYIYAIPSFAWAVWFLLRFRNHPQHDPAVNATELSLIEAGSDRKTLDDAASEATPWLAIARNPTLWMLCGQQISRAAGYMFFATWFPTFLQETRGVSVAESGYLQALVFGGTLAGSLLGGWLTDWIWRRTCSLRLSRSGVGASAMLGCAVLILAAWFVQNATLAVTLLALGALFAALAGPCAISATIDIGGKHVPQVFGIMNMSGNFAAAACPILVGALFEWTAAWHLVLLLFAGVYLAGAIFWVFVDAGRKI